MLLFEWMARAAVLSALVGVAAWALEEMLRGSQRATRLVWVGALLVSIVLPSLTLFAPDLWPESLKRSGGAIVLPEVPLIDAPLADGASVGTVAALLTDARQRWSARDLTLGLWFSAAFLLALRWLYGWQKLRALRPRWREAILAGERVLISDSFGPAVVGLLRPRVVIPSWLLLGDAERQRMIVRHEVEHTRAGDQWLLALAPILIALFPWNPALWWQLKRLRVAIELDCDARVLRGGVPALEYGSMLLDVASGTTVLPPTLAALSEPRTSLERRIRAMTPIRYRHALARAASFTALSALTLAAAIVAGAPTAAPVVAQQRPVPVVQQQEGSPLLVLDGKLLAPTAKLDFANLELKSVEVLKPADALKKFGARARFGAVVITTRSAVEVTVAEVEAAAEAVKVVRAKPVEVEIPVVRGTIAGQVIIGETGEPAVSAQVSIGNRHAITDAQGRYVIVDVPAGERTLDVRMKGYIGRQQVVVAADASTTVQEIRLNPMTETERAKFENALPREKSAAEIEKAAGVLFEEKPLIYVDGVLVGSDAKPSGYGNNVMVVIDGVIVGAGRDVLGLVSKLFDPSKIDSIEIVKGAAAAALYGERAKDGVIHITTKKR